LPETFESRERIGASALQGGTCAAGEVWPNGCALGKTLKNAEAGGPQDRKHCIPHTPRPAFQGPPVFPTFQQPDATAGVALKTRYSAYYNVHVRPVRRMKA
ncbi:hypothetical protein, partial [Phyllobacterium sp.]|uniref:hypothetical protein n=1 Tax=Phyllobacterium sp. TaxID=1871046 RepID=UPI0031FD04C9|nr:hypothetical protein [Phyllobacterium sp.]